MKRLGIAFSLLVVLAFTLRASYFPAQASLVSGIVAALAAVVVGVSPRKYRHHNLGPVVLFAVAYVVPAMWGGDTSAAVMGALIVVALGLGAVSISNGVDEGDLWLIPATVLWLGAAISLVGTVLWVSGAEVVGLVESARFAFALEYPNSLASLLTVASIIGWGITSQATAAPVYWVPTALAGFGLAMTVSRLGMGVAVVAGAIHGVRSLRTGRTPVELLGSALGGGIGLLALPLVSRAEGLQVSILLSVLLGGVVWLRLISSRGSEKAKRNVFSVSLVAGAVAAVVLFLNNAGGLRFLVDRLSADSNNLRAIFVSDAMKMFADMPFGSGAGFFRYGVLKYQQFPYASRFVHSFLGETAVDAGVLGIVAAVAIGASFFVNLRASWKEPAENRGRTPVFSLALAGAAMFVHSLGDFDLSLPAMLLLMFTFYALMPIPVLRLPWKEERVRKSFRVVGTVLLSIVAIASGLQFVANQYAARGNLAMSLSPTSEQAANDLRAAVQLAPYASDFHIQLAQVSFNIALSRQDKTIADWAVDHAKRGLALTPLNPNHNVTYALLIGRLARADDAIKQLEELVAFDRFDTGAWEVLARLNSDAAVLSLLKADYTSVRSYAEKAYAVMNRVKQTRDASAELQKRYNPGLELKPQETDAMRLAAGIGAFYSGKTAEAMQLLLQITSPQVRPDASIWRVAFLKLTNDPGYADAFRVLSQQQQTMAESIIAAGRP